MTGNQEKFLASLLPDFHSPSLNPFTNERGRETLIKINSPSPLMGEGVRG